METFSALLALAGGFPHKCRDAELGCILCSVSEQTVEQTIETPVIWDAVMTSLWWWNKINYYLYCGPVITRSLFYKMVIMDTRQLARDGKHVMSFVSSHISTYVSYLFIQMLTYLFSRLMLWEPVKCLCRFAQLMLEIFYSILVTYQGDISSSPDMIILQHDHWGQVVPVCVQTSHQKGMLLHTPEARSCLPGACHTPVPAMRLGESPEVTCGSCYATGTRQDVQSHTLTKQQMTNLWISL